MRLPLIFVPAKSRFFVNNFINFNERRVDASDDEKTRKEQRKTTRRSSRLFGMSSRKKRVRKYEKKSK